ncbi:MAG: prepilin-type N-terminal cleavage/methylation domain-containing protein, partial [Verrucomicrobiota bacterium]
SLVRRPQAGFSLLEIMVAIAILSITLVVLLSIVTNNIRATNHAKMTTAATFLARTKMVDIEDQILDVGFSDTTETGTGTFKELGYPQFRWETTIERIELPADMGQRAKDQATDDTKDAKDPMSMLTGIMGSMMSSFIEPVRIGLQESVRKVTVRVLWNEHGRPDQSFEVVQYLTDPAKADINNFGAAAAGANGTGGANGASGTGAASGSSNPLNAIKGLGR